MTKQADVKRAQAALRTERGRVKEDRLLLEREQRKLETERAAMQASVAALEVELARTRGDVARLEADLARAREETTVAVARQRAAEHDLERLRAAQRGSSVGERSTLRDAPPARALARPPAPARTAGPPLARRERRPADDVPSGLPASPRPLRPTVLPPIEHKTIPVRAQQGREFGWRASCTCGWRSAFERTEDGAILAGAGHVDRMLAARADRRAR